VYSAKFGDIQNMKVLKKSQATLSHVVGYCDELVAKRLLFPNIFRKMANFRRKKIL